MYLIPLEPQEAHMIIVTGATGALNGGTVDQLLKRLPATDIVVAARDPAKAQRFADLGIEVRQADYAKPSTLVPAFQGADQLLLVSSSDPMADAVNLHQAAIDAAVAASVGRILYTSHQGAALDTPFGPGRDHAKTEELLASSGIAWTALRNGFYAHSLTWMMGPWRESGIIQVPADGPVSWTAREDAAEAAAIIIASNEAYDGPVTLTVNAAPTFHDIAPIASGIFGRTIKTEVMDPDAWVAAKIASGQPEGMARFTLGFFNAASAGFFAGTDPLLGTLLGREPNTVQQLFAQLQTA